MAGIRQHNVILEESEKDLLESVIYGKSSKERQKRAHILLLSDTGEHAIGTHTDVEISNIVGVHVNTVERLRKRFVFEGIDAALERKPQINLKRRKLDGEAEAKLVAMACSEAPEGSTYWTLKMLADQLVEFEILESISPETVRKTLNNNHIKPWKKKGIIYLTEIRSETIGVETEM